MIIRIFDTAMDPADVEEGKRLFREQVRPVFLSFDGCSEVNMIIGVEEHSGDLVDVASISRWESRAAVDAATQTEAFKDSMAEIRRLFAQSPIVRHFELAE